MIKTKEGRSVIFVIGMVSEFTELAAFCLFDKAITNSESFLPIVVLIIYLPAV